MSKKSAASPAPPPPRRKTAFVSLVNSLCCKWRWREDQLFRKVRAGTEIVPANHPVCTCSHSYSQNSEIHDVFFTLKILSSRYPMRNLTPKKKTKQKTSCTLARFHAQCSFTLFSPSIFPEYTLRVQYWYKFVHISHKICSHYSPNPDIRWTLFRFYACSWSVSQNTSGVGSVDQSRIRIQDNVCLNSTSMMPHISTIQWLSRGGSQLVLQNKQSN